MTWRLVFTRQAQKDARKIARAGLKPQAVRLLEILKQDPYKNPPPYEVLIIGLTTDRAHLYQRTDARIDRMIENGLIDETKKLVNMGYSYGLPAMSGIGYRQIGMYLRGELELDDAVRQIRTVTHRLVRQQYTWFRLNDERIHWFDIKEDIENEVATLIKDFAESA